MTRDEPVTLTRKQIVELCERIESREGRGGDIDDVLIARLVRHFLYIGFVGVSVGLLGYSRSDHHQRHG